MNRRGYIDWLRGVAVLIMVEAHTIDAWTHPDYRTSAVFGAAGVLGGFAAPLFLFLAGVAVPLAISAKQRRGATVADAAWSVQVRGWQVFGLAFLFRLQARILSGGAWWSLLKVDILNIMGPMIALAAGLMAVCRTRSARLAALGGLTAAATLATPVIRTATWPAALPDFLEGYLRPMGVLTNFTLLPWAGFVLAGAFVGVLLDPVREELAERQANAWFAVAGAILVLVGYAGSLMPSPYEYSYFWTSSPAFFALRLGILVLALPLAFTWGRRPTASHWSPLQQFGRTSLFVYWIHVEMAYGAMSAWLHRSLTLVQWAGAYAAFVLLLLAISVLKTRLTSRRPPAERREPAPATFTA